ncbi:alpha/beta hydrolase [Flavobacterium sp. MFBS3-15]|uniref:alpha/beta fold hydrolase n=1 Tax=Flavobacterium sp. MFBS3-15 TaxID=2989816 RepID=UPI002235A056|nr:alpha/beta hydrolase [Flavobacterium sp. MFBS3-15]MCW4467630.1 alpha/beta hydrolase [Flavobacterium sp. MFBS3-15]
MTYSDEDLVKQLPGFKNSYMAVNGTELHYVEGGEGEPLILLPGWPQTWWAYHKVMPALAAKFKVLAIDIRGMGSSHKPMEGYDKKNMALDVYSLVNKLGYRSVAIAGHDIGAHVAYSFAAQFQELTSALVMLDTPHPDPSMYSLPMLPIPGLNYTYPWWVAFNQVRHLPEQLLAGKMDIVMEWIFSQMLQDKQCVSEFDKEVYVGAYNSADAIRASSAWYQAFGQDIKDSESYPKISMPVCAIGSTGYDMLKVALQHQAEDLQLFKLDGCGHFILDEQPDIIAHDIIDFLQRLRTP